MSKINTGTIALLFFAILFGLAGTCALRVAINKPETKAAEPQRKPVEMVTVPMASRGIEPGTTLVMDDVALFSMTRTQVRERVGSRVFMTMPEQIIGKTLLKGLKAGAVFNTKDFYPEGRGPGIANRLQPGQRALTIRISPVNALIGFAGPGQKVDVLFHYGQSSSGGAYGDSFGDFDPYGYNPPLKMGYAGSGGSSQKGHYRNGQYGWGRDLDDDGQNGINGELRAATTTLVQDVEILALGKNSTPTRTSTGLGTGELVSVTLAVGPRQAELIRVAEGHGDLSLTLRAPHDSRTVPLVNPVTLDQIVKLKNRVAKMEIIRGTSKSQLRFQHGRQIERRIFSDQGSTPVSPVPASAISPRQYHGHPALQLGPAGSMQIPASQRYWSPLPAQGTNHPRANVHQNGRQPAQPGSTSRQEPAEQPAAQPVKRNSYLKLMDMN